ncbi:hypothetical protein ASG43_20575 [Aureimonas sp. Leaf454]|uniref:discoidin domain-containing protein n=1 Tax=Aureimonas sp. Leaf454 TaxID=1736381 RepID=UPI0006F92B96|nr:discoidin domain-containing protein [Aureimonas sp. Leaf454]KQT51978.1 hypothetical protein ASG43_20575 [Aureimonas sp. Leaf454]
MALSPADQALLDRLNGYNGNAYNAVSNPLGFARGGNQQGVFIASVKDIAAAGALTTGAVIATAADVALTHQDASNTGLDRIATSQSVTAAAGQVTLAAAEVTKAAGKVTLAGQEADRAFTQANRAMGYANGLNLPSVGLADAGKFYRVKADGSGIETSTISFDPVYAAIAVQSAYTLLVERQTRLNALNIAELRSDRLNMVDGIVDPYGDISDINAGASSNYAFDNTAKLIGAVTAAFATVTPFSPPVQSGNVAAYAFDGNTGTKWAAQSGSPGPFLGMDYGVGNAREVRQVVMQNGNEPFEVPRTVAVQYSDDDVTYNTATSFTPTTTTYGVSIVSIPAVGAHRYWRVLQTLANANSGYAFGISELTFRAAPSPMTLRSAAFASDVSNPALARLAIQIAPPLIAGIVVPNTDLVSSVSRDGGATFTPATLSAVETLADGTVLYEGFADISGQPAGSSMAYRHVTANGKDVRISGTIMQWRA